jgi:Lipase maturation factor
MDGFSAPGYWISRLVFLRAMAVIYLVAFLVAVNQFRALMGERGMLPIPRYLRRVPFRRAPSVFHLHYSDRFFATVAGVGVVVAAVELTGLADRAPLWVSMVAWALLWALYLSIVNVGQRWYSFGWETLLTETGFLTIFIGAGSGAAPPSLVLLLLRWLLFRLEFGAGLIKIRGDPCWRDLTCLRYHHETQPLPGPLSWWFHHLPMPLHKIEVVANHCAQLVVPFALFLPQPFAGAAAAIMIITQCWLIFSGNFSWLNLLTITIAVAALGDGIVGSFIPLSAPASLPAPGTAHQTLVVVLTVVVVVLSYRPARNLVSRRQLMNYSFEPLHLVNTYGAFGHITKVRNEIVIEGTDDESPGPGTVWREYEFKGKPGDPRRRPRQVAPYHLRLDWLMWFAAISPGYGGDWFVPLVERLLENDADTLKLLGRNPFPDRPPTHVRARRYEYRYTTRQERRATGAWWHRTLTGELLPAIRLEQASARTSRRRGLG